MMASTHYKKEAK